MVHVMGSFEGDATGLEDYPMDEVHDPTTFFTVMPLFGGGSLKDFIAKRQGGPATAHRFDSLVC